MGKVEFNLGIDPDLVAQAKAAGIPVEAAAEAGLRRAIAEAHGASAEERSSQWALENAEALADHRSRIVEGGIFGADMRTW
jgi:antitoxin CcdA